MNDMSKPVPVLPIGTEPGSDAELVRLLGDYKKNRTGYGVAYGKPETEETKEELDRLHRAYWEAIHAMEKLPATGPLGLAAKAEIIQEYMPDSDDAMHGLALSLAADCISLGTSSAPAKPKNVATPTNKELVNKARDSASARGDASWGDRTMNEMSNPVPKPRSVFPDSVRDKALWTRHGTIEHLDDEMKVSGIITILMENLAAHAGEPDFNAADSGEIEAVAELIDWLLEKHNIKGSRLRAEIAEIAEMEKEGSYD